MAKKKWRVLVTAPYFQKVYPRYAERMEKLGLDVDLAPVQERLSEEALIPIIEEYDGVICGDDQFSETVLRRARRLRVISKWGTGIDSINKEAALSLGIAVRNTPGAFSEPVADTVFAFILAFSRGLHLQDQDIRTGIWEKRTCFALKGLRLGIVGVGNCGKAVARRAGGFGLNLVGNDIAPIDIKFLDETGLIPCSLPELLSESDFVSLNCDLNPTSYHLMNSHTFGLMKTGSFFISTCRGPVTEEPALVDALHSGKLAGAGLDVFEEEPLPFDSSLRLMDNVILSPHNANGDPSTADRIHESTLLHLMEELEKES
ncbi:MAG: dihydrofolate reductase [Desulfomonile tiedjei]|nr:dihydrofolate reductase [Desulfomonile tiedjei]